LYLEGLADLVVSEYEDEVIFVYYENVKEICELEYFIKFEDLEVEVFYCSLLFFYVLEYEVAELLALFGDHDLDIVDRYFFFVGFEVLPEIAREILVEHLVRQISNVDNFKICERVNHLRKIL